MQKTLFYLSVLNSLYLVINSFTYSDSFLNAPLGLTTLFAIILMFFNDRAKKTGRSSFTKTTDVLSFINILIGFSLIVFI
ncbi:hypothetical protein A0126_16565 (plasmid) [Exiguobacterium sp. N4-1P]|uniref:hypothetical protein n=1 Tax=Exiguobacterium TaxID=33986 RepID=UPI000B58FFC4|nr:MULTISPECIES: hypothetical protein [Exiguobacterium]ASI35192.1 hypothetical protein A0126_06290 [Exiguobacterium sp. N4-1P]ASI37205.1 hypothetical protein A0126_16565 [Exiguobacterium sp. N4-1P]